MTIRNILLIVATIVTPVTVSAQALSQEITVDHDVVPEQRDATRLNVYPKLTLTPLQTTRLTYSERTVRIPVRGAISILEPASYADTLETSPYNGYAALGYMPMFNLNASAGYKFIDSDHTRLSGFLQYNGTAYKRRFTGTDAEKRYVRRNTATIGLSLHQAVGRNSFIDGGADYTFARFNTPVQSESSNQDIHRVNLSALWSYGTQDLSINAGIGYGYFGYANSLLTTEETDNALSPARENKFRIEAGAKMRLTEQSEAGIKGEFDLIANNDRASAYYNATSETFNFAEYGSYTHALLTLQPYYNFKINDFRFDLSAKAQITVHSGKVLHIAPAATAAWIPSQIFSAYVKTGGGEWHNTLSSLYDITPYSAPTMAYRNSHIPFTMEIGATIGSWKGLYAKFSAEYAIANEWLTAVTDAAGITVFTPTDMKGFLIKGSAGYKYRDCAELHITYATAAPQKWDRGYYLWHDRARHTLETTLRVSPIMALDFEIGWEYRNGRSMIYRTDDKETIKQSLGTISSLKAGAKYALTPQWSVFICGENLLNRRYDLIGKIPGQGITGLAGAKYKF